MKQVRWHLSNSVLWLLSLLLTVGCAEEPAGNSDDKNADVTDSSVDADSDGSDSNDEHSPTRRSFQPVTLDGGTPGIHSPHDDQSTTKKMDDVLTAMQPLQVVLGEWNGTTRRKFDGFNNREALHWVWDFQTDPDQPALVVSVKEKPSYFQSGRLTYLAGEEKFQFTAVDKEGQTRVYKGDFTEPVQDVPGDDDKLQRTFKLTLEQVEPADSRQLVRVVFNQQQNDRYLFEVYAQVGTRTQIHDTINTMREGFSFAVSDTDYGEKTCIVSQGLGTISVSHAGRTYWVCCSGCQSAFEDDPERWIAKAKERENSE